jgi:lipid-binding SYLF domain-containing protein
MSRRSLLIAMALVVAGCGTSPPADPTAKRREIDAKVDNALAELQRTGSASELASRAEAVLVVPDVITAGFIAGGSYGQGALRKKGQTAGYYSLGAGSVGLLAGAQSKTVYVLFMTPEALRKFEQSNGWTIGADASVAVVNIGADGRVDSQTARSEVIGMVRNQTGFMANLSLEGTKFNRLSL